MARDAITLSRPHRKQSCLCSTSDLQEFTWESLFSAFADLFMPLQSLASRWMPARRRRRVVAALRYVGDPAQLRARVPALRRRAVRPHPRVLCAWCAWSTRSSPAGARGRIVISGRMADVCAELDRLAALEAAGTPSNARRLH